MHLPALSKRLENAIVAEITHCTVETNGICVHYVEQGTGPLVVLCHGFPESWYSWHHQLQALAEAGFRAVAPDMRGYGNTDRPADIDQYTLLHTTGDMVGLLDARSRAASPRENDFGGGDGRRATSLSAGHDDELRLHFRAAKSVPSGRRSVCPSRLTRLS